ncbi:NADP-dependent oxidoreductase [Rhodococcus qingshengii]|uniref:NADP-dependent oxidoreductase n=1 Tax=Rhodococcus qingshengii TaxID=334542 RepID=UPI0037C4FA9A
MRAVQFSQFDDPSVLELVELSDPHPGPGEIRIRVAAAGMNASDWKKRQGLMDPDLPQTAGYEASGTVDEIGPGVTETAVGDHVFGACPYGAAQAGYAVLEYWAALPDGLTDIDAAALPAAAETAARALDQLGVSQGDTVLINGASGNVGSAAVQLAVARGITVVGTASAGSQTLVTSLGATAITYGEGMPDRARAAAPDGIGFGLDAAGNGILPELVSLTGDATHVITVADFRGAHETGVRFSRGDTGRATYILNEVAQRAAAGSFRVNVGAVFPLSDIANAHRTG